MGSITLATAVLAFIVATLLYVIVLAIYRLTLHPLARFPGPTIAAVTGWHEFYHDIIRDRGSFIWVIDAMHKKYGPIVRITPNEIHISDPSFFDEIYAPSTKRRDKSIAWTVLGGSPEATLLTIDHHHHRLRRSALNPFFSKQYVRTREGSIKQNVEKLSSRLAAVVGTQEVLRIDVAYHGLTTDTIAEIAFGKSYGCLDMPNFNGEWKKMLHDAAANGVILRMFPWLINVLKRMPISMVEKSDPYAAGLMKWQVKLRAQVEEIIAKNNRGIKTENTIFQSILDSNLPDVEKTADRLQDEAQTVMGGGSDTTAHALSFITFFLNDDKSKLKTLREELASVVESDGTFQLSKLEPLPYLTGCIQEGVRMIYGVTTRSPRLAHEPLIYTDTTTSKHKTYTIPPFTPVGMGVHIVSDDPQIFPSPHTFNPDRWIRATAENYRLDKYLVSFSKGSRQCVAMNLAYAELYLTAAHVAWRFDMQNFDTIYERDIKITRDNFLGEPSRESKGIRVTVSKKVQ